MGGSDKLQRWLLIFGSAVAAVLLLRFALDFSRAMSPVLSATFWLLVVAALSVSFANAFSKRASPERPPGRSVTAGLLAAIPLGFLASSLDCTGLSAMGCSPFCTLIKIGWPPLLAIACLAYWFNRSPLLLVSMTLASFVPLAPHCVCYNVANGWWLDRMGASPVCYAWGFAAGMISISAVRGVGWPRLSLLVCAAIVGGAGAFFLSHHYFQFPW